MNAVIKTGGKQLTVAQGDKVLVELLGSDVGSEIRFEDVLMISGESGVKVGTPKVDGAAVVGKVLEEVKGPKLRAVKFRRRKDSQTVKGHRQKYHRVEITGIEGA